MAPSDASFGVEYTPATAATSGCVINAEQAEAYLKNPQFRNLDVQGQHVGMKTFVTFQVNTSQVWL
jgi:hypothetical protein